MLNEKQHAYNLGLNYLGEYMRLIMHTAKSENSLSDITTLLVGRVRTTLASKGDSFLSELYVSSLGEMKGSCSCNYNFLQNQCLTYIRILLNQILYVGGTPCNDSRDLQTTRSVIKSHIYCFYLECEDYCCKVIN